MHNFKIRRYGNQIRLHTPWFVVTINCSRQHIYKGTGQGLKRIWKLPTDPLHQDPHCAIDRKIIYEGLSNPDYLEYISRVVK